MEIQVSGPRILRVVGVFVVALVLVVASFDAAIGWLIPMALGGGAILAALLLLADSLDGRAALAVDRFGRGDMDIINMSRIRVAGVGGLGLVLMAGAVALQYPLISVALVAGLVGGTFMGILMIVTRRPRRGSTA
jgi:hypothetical protein